MHNSNMHDLSFKIPLFRAAPLLYQILAPPTALRSHYYEDTHRNDVNMPEVPGEVDMGPGTLRDLLVRLFIGAHLADQIIDPATGEMKMEGLFDVALNDVSYHSLREGLETPLQDGDVLVLSLILPGGG
jgi:hypothetical protein